MITVNYDQWINDFPYYDDRFKTCDTCNNEYPSQVFVAQNTNKCHHCTHYDGDICDERFTELMRMAGEAA